VGSWGLLRGPEGRAHGPLILSIRRTLHPRHPMISIPLLADHHTHPSMYSSFLSCPSLRGIKDKTPAMDAISALPPFLSVVVDWNDSDYTFSRRDLASLPPVIIGNLSFHGFAASDAALRILEDGHADLAARLGDPARLERDLPSVLRTIAGLVPTSPAGMERIFGVLRDEGVWYAEDMMVTGGGAVEALGRAGLLDRTRLWSDPGAYREMSPETRRAVHGIKLFTDGANGTRTAALGEPYAGGDRGILLHTDRELGKLIGAAHIREKAAAVHAIGDRATEQVVRVVEGFRREEGETPDVRIEHCQFISRSAAERARRLGICICSQPNFSMESDYYSDRLPPGHLENNNPYRMLIDEVGYEPGKDLLFGSDGMPHGAACALSSSLFPPRPGQRLTLEEFRAGYCVPEGDGDGRVELEVGEGRVDARVVR